MEKRYFQWIKGAVGVALAMSLSGCLTLGGSPTSSRQTQANTSRSSDGVQVGRQSFDAQGAPRACVNDLSIYHAHLQMPATQSMDLNKPVNAYVQESGSAGSAIEAVNVELVSLNQELDNELAHRNPFDARARHRSDDAIAVLEDGILLNEALVEALECRR